MSRLELNLDAVLSEVNAAAGHGAREAGEFMLTEANKHVPHDEGTLERSGTVTQSGHTAAVSYDTPYAARQHEDLTYRHDGKGQAKWLESALTAEGDTAARVAQTAMRRELGT